MMMKLDEIKGYVDELASRIGATGNTLPTYGRTEDGARPHVEVDQRGYHYVVVERGEELSRVTTNELDELLYAIFQDVTFSLALDYEFKHRVDSQDFRRIFFQRQTDLLFILSPQWSEREVQRQKQILEKHPYDDMSNNRTRLTVDYRNQGCSPEVAWQKACEQYPLPEI